MIQFLLLVKGVLLALLYLPVNLAVTALAWLLAPVLPLFASDDGCSRAGSGGFRRQITRLMVMALSINPLRIQSLRECRDTGGAYSG